MSGKYSIALAPERHALGHTGCSITPLPSLERVSSRMRPFRLHGAAALAPSVRHGAFDGSGQVVLPLFATSWLPTISLGVIWTVAIFADVPRFCPRGLVGTGAVGDDDMYKNI